MPRFRHRVAADPSPRGDVRSIVDDVFQPRHFFVGPGLTVAWQHAVEEVIPWETYQGRLLDARQTRQQRAFVSWNLVEQTEVGPAASPLISLKWDASRGEVHVVRGLLCHVWESFDAGGNIIESRETTKWLMELVGTIVLADFNDEDELHDELICRLWQAVVGTSRLPLTSLEAPLPGFVLGQLAFVNRPRRGDEETPRPGDWVIGRVMRDWRELIENGWTADLAWREHAKLLEVVLRAASPEEVSEAAALCMERWKTLGHSESDLFGLFWSVFNAVSLSPWTQFADNAMAFVQRLRECDVCLDVEGVQFLSWLLLKLSGHLTAYDLVTFHHGGANYPDALLLDLVLKHLFQDAELNPGLYLDESYEKPPSWWTAAELRSAFLHGVMLRRTYEGHAVPDAPTSPGENTRVLPAPYLRVPEEQLSNLLRRQRKLFADDPLAVLWTTTTKKIFQRSLDDLSTIRNIIDLGRAVFIDRPLGFGKAPLEPDQSPLLAHSLYSEAIARRRMDVLADLAREMGLLLPANWQQSRAALEPTWVDGTPINRCRSLGRPVAQLADAERVSSDFVVVETLAGSVQRLRDLFDWNGLELRFPLTSVWSGKIQVLRIASGEASSVMAIWDGSYKAVNPHLLFESDPSRGFRCRGGVELPVAGLRIWQVIDDQGKVHDLRGEEVHVLPRW